MPSRWNIRIEFVERDIQLAIGLIMSLMITDILLLSITLMDSHKCGHANKLMLAFSVSLILIPMVMARAVLSYVYLYRLQ